MAAQIERPTNKRFLSKFYDLADFNPNKRLKAIEELINDEELENYKLYVLDRLLKGLVSGKTAARFGFSSFLILFLNKFKTFEFNELVEKIDRLLPIADEKDFENVVGRHFVYMAFENTELFKDHPREITEAHLNLIKVAPYLTFAVADSIIKRGEDLDETEFKKWIYPSIKPALNVELEKISLEGLLFLISFSQSFPDVIKDSRSFSNKKVAFRPVVYERFLELLKCMDVSHKSNFCKVLLIFSKRFGRFDNVFNEVALKLVSEGDESKTSERYFSLCKDLFAVEEFKSSELSSILSTDFIQKCRKYSHRTGPSYKGHHLLISGALEAFKLRVEEGVFSSPDLLVLIERIDNVESGDFDTKVGVSVRITEFLVSKLAGCDLEGFAQRVSSDASWSFKRLIPAFANAAPSVKTNILKSFLSVHERSIHRFNVGCSFLEHIFKIKKHIHVTATEEDKQVVLDVTDTKSEGNQQKSLIFFAACLKYLGKIAETDELATQYLNDAREIVLFSKSVKNKIALIDSLLAIMSHVNRIHKVLVCYTMGQLGDVLDAECSQFLIKTLGKSAVELEGDSEDEDGGDFKPISEEERQQVLDKWANEEDEEDSEDEEEDVGDDDEEEEVDEELVANMKKALGKYAFNGESDEDIEMDDAEIEELDRSLGEALKKSTRKGKKVSDESLSVFRSKCFDLLVIFLTHAKATVIVKSLGSLSELIASFDVPEDEKFLSKINAVLEAVHSHKKEIVDSKVVKVVWEHIVEESMPKVRSVRGRRLLGDVFSLLLTFAADHQNLVLPKDIRNKVFELVEAELETQDSNLKASLQEVLEFVLSKYPAYLADIFPRIAKLIPSHIDKADEMFKLITFSCRRDVLQKDESTHGLNLISAVIPVLNQLYADLSLLKPSMFAKTVIFIYKYVTSATDVEKDMVRKSFVVGVLTSDDFKTRVSKLNREIQQECKCKTSLCIQRVEAALN